MSAVSTNQSAAHAPETAFNALLSAVTPGNSAGKFSASIQPSWLQGRTAFGGLSTALVIQAMLQQVEPERQLRTLAVSFVGPAPAGDHVITTRILREGGSVTHMQGELLCSGDVAVSVNAAFGKARASTIDLPGPELPPTTTPEDSTQFPYIEGLTPEFTRHFDMRLERGAMPFSGADSADFAMWLRFREAQPMTLAHLVAIGDVPPMPGLNMIKPPGVGSSLSWYVEFPADIPALQADEFVYYDYHSQAAGDGYFNNVATLWSQAGQPLMFGRQVATVFER